MKFSELIDNILANTEAPSPELLAAAEAAIDRLQEREPERLEAWVERVARWVTDTDFGEYE